MALKRAKPRGQTLQMDWRRLVPLAAGTLLLLLGIFCAWQTWLIADEGSQIDQVHAAQSQAVQAMAGEVATERTQIQHALRSIDPSTALRDSATTIATLHRQLPQALKLELYSGDLNEVLHADFHRFGYAKAAQLMAAQNADGPPLMQSFADGVGGRRLSVIVPLGAPPAVQALLWVELPFAPLQQRFQSIAPAGGRLDLRQSDDHGEMSLISNGSTSAIAEVVGKPVAGSVFDVGAALPDAFIVLPHTWPLAGLLSLFGVGGGAFLLWRRRHPVVKPVEPESVDIPMPARVKTTEAAPIKALGVEPSDAAVVPSVAPSIALDPSIFRAYDVRGVVGKTLNKNVAHALGQAIGTLMVESGLRDIVVGRDGRLSGPELAGALSDGLRHAGINVIDIGAAPTPVVYFAAFRYNTGCCVAVTGSHNPPDYNGFKIVVGGETLSEGAIQDLYQRIVTGKLISDGEGSLRPVDVSADYLEKIIGDVQAERPLKIVVDCGNGIPGAFAPQVLEGIGCEVIPLFCEVDGTFPNHHPDPSDPHNLTDLIVSVKNTGADLGIAFDGDGDRLGVVTRAGEIIFPDRLLMLFARDVLSRQPGATVIYDVKCTGHLKGQILDAGGSPMMWRTGHSLIKAKMRETDAALAGEMSGHFFFKERWYGFDDGIYAAARLMEILAGDMLSRTPEEIFATLPKSLSTPELKIELAEGEHYRFMEKFRQQASFGEATLIVIDGLRADWPDGWGLVRASNTTPVLVLRFEADTATALKRVQQVFREQLLAVDATLKLPF